MTEERDFSMDNWIKEVLEKGEKQIKLELEDYWRMMDVYSKILDKVTDGRMSKTTYTYDAICEVLDEKEFTNQGVDEE